LLKQFLAACKNQRQRSDTAMFSFWTLIVCLKCSCMVVARRQNHALNVQGDSGATTETEFAAGPGSAAWQRKTYMFCLNEEVEIKCDGPDQTMQVTGAVYNRNSKAGENECGAFESEWKSCNVNAKKMVEDQCKGTSGCHLIPSDHASCEEEAFQQMRLVIKCRTAGEGETIRPQPLRPGSDLTTQAPMEVKNAEMGVKNAELGVMEELEDKHLQEVAFTPCYRSLAVEKVIDGDIEADSWRAELSSSVSSCGINDGCFHLTFPEGMVYSDENEPPTSQELIAGELKEVGENMWVTYEGVGLKTCG